MAVLQLASRLPHPRAIWTAPGPSRLLKRMGGAEECRLYVGEWRQQLEYAGFLWRILPRNPSSLVVSCSAGVWCGGHPRHAGSTVSTHPGPLLATPGLAASFPCLHLLLTAGTMHTASRNIFPEHCFYHAPPQLKNLQLEVLNKSSQSYSYAFA